MPHEEAVIINNKLDNPDTEVQTSNVEDKSKENSNEPTENQLTEGSLVICNQRKKFKCGVGLGEKFNFTYLIQLKNEFAATEVPL